MATAATALPALMQRGAPEPEFDLSELDFEGGEEKPNLLPWILGGVFVVGLVGVLAPQRKGGK